MKLPGLFPNELRIVCTGRGEHAPRELALLNEGSYESDTALSGIEKRFSVAQGVRTRRTRADVEKPNEAKGEVVQRPRADGGVTFEFPPCPTCSPGQPRIIRDDKLAAFMRGAPGKMLDVSLIP
jgi:hypothetical protein